MIYAFDGFEIDTERMELRKEGQAVAVEPLVFDLLRYLVLHRERIVSIDELFENLWAGRTVSLSTLTSRINAVRQALGDSGAAQRFIKTQYKRGYRFAVNVSTRSSHSAAAGRAMPKQDIQFCTSSDGTRIAYARAGSGLPVVKTGNWMNHLEYDWESPVWSHLLHWLADGRQLIRYDARGNGLSDWDVQDIIVRRFCARS